MNLINPWLKLDTSANSYLLDEDREAIARYNFLSRDPKKRVILDSIPEPFIGNPDSAKVVLLGLNPGHSENDRKAHDNPDFRKAMFHNLRREKQDYPFYPLNPKFGWTGAGKWWLKRTSELREAVGGDPSTLAERLLVIEWFPYHSERSGLSTKRVCESQEYSFQLAKKMLEEKLVIGMRSKPNWVKVDKRFGQVPFLNSPQNTYITKGNMDCPSRGRT